MAGTLVKSVQIDIGVKGDAASKAKLDSISAKAEELKKAFPEYKLKIDSAAAAERIKVFKDELRSIPNDTTAKVKVKVDDSALSKLSKSGFLKPSLGGSALALSPSLIPLAGGIAGAVGAIGISFGAAAAGAGLFGLAAASVLSQASSDAQKLSALNAKLATAQTAAQKKAVRQQIEALTIGWAKGYATLIGQYQDFHQKWKAASQAIAVPALTTWLGALTKGLPLLVTAVKPVADVFGNWGQILKDNFSSPAIMKNLQGMAAAFGRFSAGQLTLVGGAIADIALGVFHLGKDLAGSGANFSSFGIWLNNIGSGFLTWSKSKQARADVQGFLDYMHKNGALVTGILKDLGKILPGILQGVSGTGQLELQAISGFLGFIAKLPKGWQAPLTEAAGAILLLSKTGVLKVGFTVVGAAAGWVKKLLGGASVDIGGSAAAAEMRAAMVSGGSAAAAEIRAAMAGGGAAGAGEGAAGGAAAGAAAKGGIAALAGSLSLVAAGIVAGGIIKGFGDALAPAGTVAGKLNKALQKAFDLPGFNIFSGYIAKSLPALGDFISTVNKRWADFLAGLGGAAQHGAHVVANWFDSMRRWVSGTFDTIRHSIASAWDTIWSNTVARVKSGISTVVGWFAGLPRRAVGALFGLGHSLAAFASAAMGQMWTGFKNVFGSVIHWFQGLPRMILHALGVHSPPGWAVSAGKWIMKGLHIGLGHGLGQLTSFTTSIGAQVAAGLGGGFGGIAGNVRSYSKDVLAVLRMLGQPASDLGVVLSQMSTESGGNPTIVNTTDSNWLAGHPSVGLMQVIRGTFDAYAGPYRNTGPFEWGVSTNPMANIFAGLNYATSRYGAGWTSVLGHGHGYDQGGWLMPGLTLAMNKTGRPERVLPPGGSSGDHRVVIEFRTAPGASGLAAAIVEVIQHHVEINGGDAQVALGAH